MLKLRHITILFFFGVAAFTGCCLVDEDMSDCGEELDIDYQLQLVTNMHTEIQTVLDLQTDLQVATTLQEHLEVVFTDFAHDVDLSFYDAEEPMMRLEHFDVKMDASQTSYTLNLPGRNYMHLCSANLEAEPLVSLEGDERCETARLVQHMETKDTVDAQTTGIFTARKRMVIDTSVDQHFDVELYMVNAATALVLDLEDAPTIRDMKVFLSGFADSFSIADSTYSFNSEYIVRTQRVSAQPGTTELCFASTHFPSRDEDRETKVIIDTDEPFISDESDEEFWQWRVYAYLDDGSVTESILHVHTPLRAGQLKVVKCRVHADGTASTEDRTVGVSVCLDWEPGQEHVVDL